MFYNLQITENIKCSDYLAVVDAKSVAAILGSEIQNFELDLCPVGYVKGLSDVGVSGILFGVIWCLELPLSLTLDHIGCFDLCPSSQEALPVLQDVTFKSERHCALNAYEWSWQILPTEVSP